MTESAENLAANLRNYFGDRIQETKVARGEVTVEVTRGDLLDVCYALRDERRFAFDQLIDLCGVDYSDYGRVDFRDFGAVDYSKFWQGEWIGPRFAVVYHLLSLTHNRRLRVRVFADDDDFPVVDSVNEIWNAANWFEREAFDLFGIIFEGHPDLRRILTDYGFVGYPFRKDFPLIGEVEVRYDPEKQRVVYQPVSIEPRVTQPRVIRQDNRYEKGVADGESTDA